jgi:hypothetical protein
MIVQKKLIMEGLTQNFGSSFPWWPRIVTERLQACRNPQPSQSLGQRHPF